MPRLDTGTTAAGQLMRCVQGMLRRIEGADDENAGATKATIERAKTVHARYHAFTHGNFEQLWASDRTPATATHGHPTSCPRSWTAANAAAPKPEDQG